jgi:hypothetical protein
MTVQALRLSRVMSGCERPAPGSEALTSRRDELAGSMAVAPDSEVGLAVLSTLRDLPPSGGRGCRPVPGVKSPNGGVRRADDGFTLIGTAAMVLAGEAGCHG